jgi:hypothetical protein
MHLKEQFEITSGYKKTAIGMLIGGAAALLLGIVTFAFGKDPESQHIFWAALMHNSIFFLLVCNASMFFLCATILAMGGWPTSFRRIPEAISSCVPVLGAITLFVLGIVLFKTHIYHWNDAGVKETDEIIKHKAPFLNKYMFVILSIVAVGGWSWLGQKIRTLSYKTDKEGTGNLTASQWIYKNTIWASLFLVLFGLTVGSTLPWMWIMSLDPHWYSTMFSWYTFASSFVSGMSLVALYIVYLKTNNYLEYTNDEHLHDVGKFMFAFSVFWTYLWFSQFMLIWYANIPEETVYFKPRLQGPYRGIFFFNLIINFIAPLLVLMRRGSKRNYNVITFMAVLIIFGHWIDFMQMVMPSVLKDPGAHGVWGFIKFYVFDFGLFFLFMGLIIWLTGKQLARHSLIPKRHPFMKESVIHFT